MSELKSYTLVYRPGEEPEPMLFRCQAENIDHAREQLESEDGKDVLIDHYIEHPRPQVVVRYSDGALHHVLANQPMDVVITNHGKNYFHPALGNNQNNFIPWDIENPDIAGHAGVYERPEVVVSPYATERTFGYLNDPVRQERFKKNIIEALQGDE